MCVASMCACAAPIMPGCAPEEKADGVLADRLLDMARGSSDLPDSLGVL